ncbi:MAG: hypothetical protein R3F17_14085 [Planctomycetota bacterium]
MKVRIQVSPRAGMVMLAVLMVLLALFVLCGPFLASSRDSVQQGNQVADGTQARYAMAAATEVARARLGKTHPALDATPDSDSLDELTAPLRDLGGQPGQAQWGIGLEDESGRIDLGSASPGVLANLLGWQTRLVEVIDAGATEAAVDDPGTLDPEGGVVIAGGEWIRYGTIKTAGGTRLLQLERGLETTKTDDGYQTRGPLPPRSHAFGTPLIDQRVYAFLERRVLGGELGELRRLDVMEELPQVQNFAMESFGDGDWRAVIETHTSCFTEPLAGGLMGRAVRVEAAIEADSTVFVSVSDTRDLGPGTLICIEGQGNREWRYVSTSGGGRVGLHRVLEHDYDAQSTVITPLIRRPVNINTASPDVLRVLFENLALQGSSDRISSSEANRLVARAMGLRPFQNREDFLRRLVLPAAGLEAPEGEEPPPALISSTDAMALYLNGLCANDARLSFATMPFAFASGDVFRLDVAVSVDAPAGIERVFQRRELVQRVVPQQPLMALMHRQEDFEADFNLLGNGPWWMTGPRATNVYDGSRTPPSRLWAHLGTKAGQVFLPGVTDVNDRNTERDAGYDDLPVQHVFADREPGGWAQLGPARLGNNERRNGRVLHFDFESSDPEGRLLPDAPLDLDVTKVPVAFVPKATLGLLPGISTELWLRTVGEATGSILDLNLGDPRTNRVQLGFGVEGLELRVLDNFGDHPATPMVEAGRITVPVGQGGAGIAPGLWNHVRFSVLGNRPSQMELVVNGMASGVEIDGQTRTTVALNEGDGIISVISTRGFPQQGVARVGSELVEYVLGGDNSLICSHQYSGALAGFGGRMARHERGVMGDPTSLPPALGAGLVRAAHPVGTLVEHYGYSTLFDETIPAGQGQLNGPVGPFRVAVVRDVGTSGSLDPLPIDGVQGLNLTGIEGDNLSNLVLELADGAQGGSSASTVMEAFHSGGGYALLVQAWGGTQFSSGLFTAAPKHTPIGGVEVIRYAGKTGNELIVTKRGAEGELGVNFLSGAHAYILDYGGAHDVNGNVVDELSNRAVYCIPISIPVNGASMFEPANGRAKFAQITHNDARELSEWVRYDVVAQGGGHLVRIDRFLVEQVQRVITGFVGQLQTQPPGGGLVPPAGGDVALGPISEEPGTATTTVSSAMVAQGTQGGSLGTWTPILGTADATELPLTRTVSDFMRFRGACETQDSTHTTGTLVLPVFRIRPEGDAMPGALDAVFLDAGGLGSGAQTGVVHRGWIAPQLYVQRGFTRTYITEAAAATTSSNLALPPEERGRFVALSNSLFTPIILDPDLDPGDDIRILPRMAKFPSGERPASVEKMRLGGEVAPTFEFPGVAPVVVDEVAFQTLVHGNNVTTGFNGDALAGAGIVLGLDTGVDDQSIALRKSISTSRGELWIAQGPLQILPHDVGLARIGQEYVCYTGRDWDNNVLYLAPGGRGLLGTVAVPHCGGEVLYPVPDVPTSMLIQPLEPEDTELVLGDAPDFPEEGLVLVGDELIHYTSKRGQVLLLPRGSLDPGCATAAARRSCAGVSVHRSATMRRARR